MFCIFTFVVVVYSLYVYCACIVYVICIVCSRIYCIHCLDVCIVYVMCSVTFIVNYIVWLLCLRCLFVIMLFY